MEGPDDIEELIRNENAGECVDDQVEMAYWFYDNDVTEPDDREKRTAEIIDALENDLEHAPETVLGNLVDINVVERVPVRGSGTYIRNHRTGTNYYSPNDQEFVASITEEITRLLLDIRDQERKSEPAVADGGEDNDSVAIREVAADAIGATPDNLVQELTGTIQFINDVPELEAEDQLQLDDPVVRMNNFDVAAKAVVDHERIEQRREYEPMGWRNVANRYTLTQKAKAIEDNHSVSDF